MDRIAWLAAQQGLAADTSQLGVLSFGSLLASTLGARAALEAPLAAAERRSVGPHESGACMAKPRGSDEWSSIKGAVHDKPAPELVNLLRDLYELSPANRQFLHARFGSRSRVSADVIPEP